MKKVFFLRKYLSSTEVQCTSWSRILKWDPNFSNWVTSELTSCREIKSHLLLTSVVLRCFSATFRQDFSFYQKVGAWGKGLFLRFCPVVTHTKSQDSLNVRIMSCTVHAGFFYFAAFEIGAKWYCSRLWFRLDETCGLPRPPPWTPLPAINQARTKVNPLARHSEAMAAAKYLLGPNLSFCFVDFLFFLFCTSRQIFFSHIFRRCPVFSLAYKLYNDTKCCESPRVLFLGWGVLPEMAVCRCWSESKLCRHFSWSGKTTATSCLVSDEEIETQIIWNSFPR